MKFRSGFVSNSSSSSFIITKDISIHKVTTFMDKFWKEFLSEPVDINNHESYPSFVQETNEDNILLLSWDHFTKRQKRKALIKWFDEYACWNPWEPLRYNYEIYSLFSFRIRPKFLGNFLNIIYHFLCGLFFGTYLSEAMKSKVYMVAKDNAVPYEVLKKMEKEFGKDIKIHYHMG